jgi:hypothetical protein
MKNFYSTFCLMLLTMGVYAQRQQMISSEKSQIILKDFVEEIKFMRSSALETPFVIDYSAADGDNTFYLWRFNSRYTDNLNFIGVSIDSVAGYLPGTPNVIEQQAYPQNITFSDITILYSHENNSGTNDTIIAKIVSLDNDLPTGTTLWADTVITNTSLSPGGNWLGTNALTERTFSPQFRTTATNQRVGFVLEYYGSLTDTFGLLAGFRADPDSPNPNDPLAFQSRYENSYMRFPPNIPGVIETSNVGYGTPPGTEGWFEAQNWVVVFDVMLGPLGTSNFNYQNLLTVYPNPATDKVFFNFKTTVSSLGYFHLYDMSGRKVKSLEKLMLSESSEGVSIEVGDLEKGIYFYSFAIDNSYFTGKINLIK